MWTDTHCHVHEADDAGAQLAEARVAGVGRVVAVGTDVGTSRAAADLAAADLPAVRATAGVHPHDAASGLEGLAGLLGRSEVVAVGECGLDYHYDRSPRAAQRAAFGAQVGLAAEHGKALVVHTREAWEDTFAALAEAADPARVVLHCFTGGPDEARRALERGFTLSFSGIVTFKGAAEVREAAALCPSDRLVVETDSPFLAPVPHRGRPNRPAWVPVVGAAVAAARGVSVEEVEATTTANAERLFGFTGTG